VKAEVGFLAEPRGERWSEKLLEYFKSDEIWAIPFAVRTREGLKTLQGLVVCLGPCLINLNLIKF